MFKSFWDWFLVIAIFVMLVLVVGEIYSFYRDRRSSALFAALSYILFASGLAFYFSESLWLRYIIGPIVFLFSLIVYWVSFNTRKEEHAPRPIFMTKAQKEKEAEKQAKLDKKRTAGFSASGTIAAEKRGTARTTPGAKPGGTGSAPRPGMK